MSTLTQQEVQEILDQVMREIVNRNTSICLSNQEATFSEDICTVYTTFEGGYHAALILYADTTLLTRLTQRIIHVESVNPQDLADFSKEYFNIICGQIVARLFRAARISSRFQIPSFHKGRYMPFKEEGCQYVLNYTSNRNEGVQLVHHTLT